MNLDRLVESCKAIGIELSEEQQNAFRQYHDALYEANQVMNLTRVPQEEAWSRHFLDSLLFQDLVPEGASVLDIGTGPGFPSWPLAVARPDLTVTAIDSNGKMLGFLQSQPLPNLTVLQVRAEEWGVREEFDVVTGRAVAPLAVQMEISAAPLKQDGLFIPMRTPADDFDLASPSRFGLVLERMLHRESEAIGAVRVFPVYRKVKATPARYPRRWAEIKKG